jgi:hypothetical protein
MSAFELLFTFVWALFWIFGWGGLFWGMTYLRRRSRDRRLEMLHKERMAAMEKGIPLPELPDIEVLEAQTHRVRRPVSMLLPAIVCIAAGAGAMMALNLAPDPDLHRVWTLPLPVVFVGFGLLLYHLLTQRSSN